MAVDKDPKTFKLSVRLSDRSLAYVLPLGGILPMAAAGWLVGRAEVKAPEPMEIPKAPHTAPPPPPARRR